MLLADARQKTALNRLIDEKSPYLIQHAGNPVNWYPWEEEAFDKARKEDEPPVRPLGLLVVLHPLVRLNRSGEGVPPLQLGETSEIRIGRGQLAAMFNGKSCQMCVCHQIGDSLTIREHLLENSPVSLGRPNDSRTGLIQPALYTSKCLFEYCLREKF